jgi:prepilin-type N-terminal cleavage/methylation domain-containing protein
MRRARAEHGFSLVELLAVVALIGIISSFAIPMVDSTITGYRLRSESKTVAGLIGLAKMRATSRFSRARVYADLAANSYRLEVFDKATDTWQTDGAVTTLAFGVRFGFGALATAPPNTQDAIGQSAQCTNDADAVVANTACVLFNSRGIPIDTAGAPLGGNALYMTDGVGVRVTTITATPLVREWWSAAHSANWVPQ